MSDNTVIAALTIALEKSPDDESLRLHLAQVLLSEGDAQAALEHYKSVLGNRPAHNIALQGAARAARVVGDESAASGYEQLLKALGAGEPNDPDNAPSPDNQPRLKVMEGGQGNVVSLVVPEESGAISLDDVAGLNNVKRRLDISFLQPIRNPELTQRYGKKVKGGLLLYGPPGCGKTYVARALAGELTARFIPVGLNDVLNMWLGESEQRLHALFQDARQRAPAVLFFDEMDALGRSRSELGNSSIREVVNQLLAELDGIDGAHDSVFVLGATNLPWDIDDALMRPGRFDRRVFVCPPDDAARIRLVELNLAGKPAQDIRIADLVKRTRGFSGADVAYLCEVATEFAMEEAIESGNTVPIEQRHFKKALKEVRSSVAAMFSIPAGVVWFVAVTVVGSWVRHLLNDALDGLQTLFARIPRWLVGTALVLQLAATYAVISSIAMYQIPVSEGVLMLWLFSFVVVVVYLFLKSRLVVTAALYLISMGLILAGQRIEDPERSFQAVMLGGIISAMAVAITVAQLPALIRAINRRA